MEASLIQLLTPLLPSLDGPLVEYLAAVAVQNNAAKWTKSAECVDAIGEMLATYEAVANEKEAKAKCVEIFNKMSEAGLLAATKATAASASSMLAAHKPAAISTAVKPSLTPSSSPSAPPSSSPQPVSASVISSSSSSSSSKPSTSTASQAPAIQPQPGYLCQARFTDGQWYAAQVLSVKTIPVTRVRVKYTKYGDEEELPLTSIKDLVSGELPKPKAAGKKAERVHGEEDDSDSSDDDSSDDEGDESSLPSGGPRKLLSNPVRIGEDSIGPTLAQMSLSEREKAKVEAERLLTPKELKRLKKQQAKAEKAAADLTKSRQWNPDEHRKALTQDALPIYLQSQHLSKKAGTKDIALEDVTLLSPDNTELLSQTELRLTFGRKYGLIGRNGIGKSTLLRQISTYTLPKFPTWIKIMHVEQEVVASTSSVLEVVLAADLERTMLLKEEQELTNRLKQDGGEDVTAAAEKQEEESKEPPSPTSSTASGAPSVSSTATTVASASSTSSSSSSVTATSDRLTAVYDRLLELDSATAKARAGTILAGLQFTQEMTQMPTKALSGGWRMRVALACALFVSPDLLLLDEPTNHLDFPAVLWLQSYLQAYPKTVLIVSHDRVFLNAVITDTIWFTNKKRLEYYRGDYSNFLRLREERYKTEKRAYEAQQLQRQHIIDYITTFRTEKKSAAQDKKTPQVVSKQKQLDKMVLLENPDAESTDKFSLRFPDPGPLRVPLIAEIKGLSFKYPKRNLAADVASAEEEERRRIQRQQGTLQVASVTGQVQGVLDDAQPNLLEDVSVRVEITSRIGIIGANGCGKSTLIKILLGELQTTNGIVSLNSNVRCAYFTQHHVDQLNLGVSAVQWLRELFPGTLEVECRRHLGRFGLIGDLVLMQIGHLSGGQKSRLAFAIICWKEPHMLIMDEPTNHLDLETIDVLIRAINEWKGCVMIVSHDQHFLQGCLKEFWSLHDRKLEVFDSFEACKRATYRHLEV